MAYLSNEEIHHAGGHGDGEGGSKEGEEPGRGIVTGSESLRGEVSVQLGQKLRNQPIQLVHAHAQLGHTGLVELAQPVLVHQLY